MTSLSKLHIPGSVPPYVLLQTVYIQGVYGGIHLPREVGRHIYRVYTLPTYPGRHI